MSKSVLVMETPEKGCVSCLIGQNHSNSLEACIYCPIAEKCVLDEKAETIPDWCPLMDLPEKDNGDFPYNIFSTQKCAKCGTPVIGNKISKYCSECGQKIDWGEE